MDDEKTRDNAGGETFVPTGWQLERAVSAWQELKERLADDEELANDEGVIAHALKLRGAEDPRDLLGALIDAVYWCERRAEEGEQIAAEFTTRRRRFEARAVVLRELVHQLMEAIEVRKYATRLARAQIMAGRSGLRVTDEAKIPDEYFKVERTLRKSDVLADIKLGVVIEGAEISNGGPVLQVARVR